jgi:hypothetical protein
MPVVPAPAEEEMPRIEIALVELSIDTPGVKRAMSWKSLMPRASMASWVSAVTLIGTLLRASSWRVAVTTTSCSPPALGALPALLESAGTVCSSACAGGTATSAQPHSTAAASAALAQVEFFIA